MAASSWSPQSWLSSKLGQGGSHSTGGVIFPTLFSAQLLQHPVPGVYVLPSEVSPLSKSCVHFRVSDIYHITVELLMKATPDVTYMANFCYQY